ncbi:MAG TPA: hypothetical protein VK957_16970 [Lunatimonas sp.]|nr:hypothetical protein [Lunatimonas sp.]
MYRTPQSTLKAKHNTTLEAKNNAALKANPESYFELHNGKLIILDEVKRKTAQSVRERRLLSDLTQEGLFERSSVPLATLRKFEQKGLISLESLLKILLVVGGLEE